MRSAMSIAALVLTVLATVWVAVTHLPNEARAAQAEPQAAVAAENIRSIAFDGADLPLAALRASMSMHVGAIVDDAQLDHDRDAMVATLAGQGYLAATVGEASVTFAPDGAYIMFDVDKGPLFHVRAVEVSGPGAKEAPVVTIAAGDVALADHLEIARTTLDDALEHRTVQIRTHEDRMAAAVDVELVVQ